MVPSVFPKTFIKKKWINEETDIFPIGGVSNVTTVFCKEGDEFSIYKVTDLVLTILIVHGILKKYIGF